MSPMPLIQFAMFVWLHGEPKLFIALNDRFAALLIITAIGWSLPHTPNVY